MVSEVGWLVSVCSPHCRLTSRGSAALNSSASHQVCQPKTATDRSARCCTAWEKKAEDALTSTKISAADRKKYDTVIGQFDRFFKVQKNVIFEWALFNCRCQGQSETAEQFITSLYSLVENCEYGELKDQMIHDCIVMGICDQSHSTRLQIDPELTLEKAKTLMRQREAVQEQQSLL